MGNASSKSVAGSPKSKIEKHGSADSQTPLFAVSLPSPGFRDPEKDSIRGALRELNTRTHPGDDNATQPVPPTTPVASNRVTVDEMEGHSDVSRPPSEPRRLWRLSEIIDVDEVTENGHVRSPSGNLLDRDAFIAHPERPLTLRERQQRILERVRAAEQAGSVERGTAQEVSDQIDKENEGGSEITNEKKTPKKRSKPSWFCCF